ncbi:MAG: M1 family metallopeptidase [Actinomycetia bacterium]|nr:M1 family metallopeptidase [Actinomycetes bacterium]
MTPPTDDRRLPTDAAPRHYAIELAPDVQAGRFTGGVSIDVDLRTATDSITLHALELQISTVSVTPRGAQAVAATVETDSEREWITLRLEREVPAGEATIQLAYEGGFCDQLVGLYTSNFEVGGETHQIVVSQCESTHARRFVPCFDEPEFKATFAVSLVVPHNMTAISNAAEASRESAGVDSTGQPTVRVTFAPTVVMSTYLLAVVVGPLEATDPRMVAGRNGAIALRVVHPPGQGHLCDFALDVAEAALRFFEDWYDLPYPGDKVDLIAVPDFAFGAMENLGAITFREVLLLVDPEGATPQELQRVADVINHELAHMWFGNLVTMKWWNGIWLNEAFATFMEVTASDAFRPEWDVWTSFGLARAAAFDTDALRSTRPIEYEVVTAADSEAMFDILTYEKGCSVVRMLEQYLGPERFRDGIRSYLRKHAWGNTETTDLWDSLEEASGEPVRWMMDSWIFNGGHPLVTVERDGASIRLDQRRALADPHGDASDPGLRFPVPMVLRTSGGDHGSESQRILLDEPREVPVDPSAVQVQPNAGGAGFYRTLLDGAGRRALAESPGTPLERFVLVDDTWFAMRSGLIGADEALDTVFAVIRAGETDPAVWRRISAVGADLVRLGGREQGEAATEWVRVTLGNALRGFAAPADAEGRPAEVVGAILGVLGGVAGDKQALGQAESAFDRSVEPGAIDPAVAAGALDAVGRHCDDAQHSEIERRWREAGTPQDEQRHLAALVLTADPAQFSRALELVRTRARTQDAPYVLRRALTNVTLGGTAWHEITSNWDEVVARFPTGSLPRMLEGIRTFTDADLAAEATGFLADNPLPSGGRQVEQHVEAMHATVRAAARLRSAPFVGAGSRPA